MKNDLSDTVIVVTREGMGSGPLELQTRLLSNYLRLLLENDLKPGAFCFYTDGVKVLAEGSPVLELFQALEQRGVRLVVCKTCLDYFGLTEKLRVGLIGGMGDIQAAQVMASKVIPL
ncbi:MAG: DsrE family protein [Deltaproteobacteria bacterium]|nr:DsrE family protein [Deltaproteobacteria bacterium]